MKVLIYISLFLSFCFSLLSISLQKIVQPNYAKFFFKFQKYTVIAKLLILSQRFYYKFFGNTSKYRKLIFYVVLYTSNFIMLFGFFFRVILLKYEIIAITNPIILFIILFIIAINTVFRSFVTFAITMKKSNIFKTLVATGFFTTLRDPYWRKHLHILKNMKPINSSK